MLLGSDIGWIRLARVSDDSVRPQAERARRCDEPIAPVAEAVTVALEWDGGRRDDIVRLLQVRDARGMDIEHDDHGGGLRKLIRHLAANSNAHGLSCALGTTRLGGTQGAISGALAGCKPPAPAHIIVPLKPARVERGDLLWQRSR